MATKRVYGVLNFDRHTLKRNLTIDAIDYIYSDLEKAILSTDSFSFTLADRSYLHKFFLCPDGAFNVSVFENKGDHLDRGVCYQGLISDKNCFLTVFDASMTSEFVSLMSR